ncbi:MAG: M48 family metallopeptidase [Candidatus Eisenbacteria bacterium]|uniref:M48 family metallopeptidase n=1 Tax=Eiseniibacteriota bacterium TaxID=2212470 RepID=A0A956LY23_UNCEI|nr:M48 family metallopeptidase [Candidatus Eisenbacteria bacterium]
MLGFPTSRAVAVPFRPSISIDDILIQTKGPQMRSRSSSLRKRAVLAFLIPFGFYLVALAVLAVLGTVFVLLLMSPVVDARVLIALILGMMLVVLAVVVSTVITVVSSFEKWDPPGILLEPEAHPGLFGLIAAIGQSLGEGLPKEVYLSPEINAAVTARGGFLGLGRRRVLVVGLPVLHLFTVSELEAILTHEFGHYYGGDLALLPWIRRSHEQVLRSLGILEGHPLVLPFRWYAEVLLGLTAQVVREQELAADRLAVERVGAPALERGLKKLCQADALLDSYRVAEANAVFSAGFRPPVAAGLPSFLEAPAIAPRAAEALEREWDGRTSQKYDTHPCLRERVEAMKDAHDPDGDPDDRPAIVLLSDPDGYELALHRFVTPGVGDLEPIAWEDVGERVAMEHWREVRDAHASVLDRYPPESYPEAIERLGELSAEIVPPNSRIQSPEDRKRFARTVLGAGLAVALRERGWSAKKEFGQPPELAWGAKRIDPIVAVRELADGRCSREDWMEMLSAPGAAADRA